jgi:hypothetical protein
VRVAVTGVLVTFCAVVLQLPIKPDSHMQYPLFSHYALVGQGELFEQV